MMNYKMPLVWRILYAWSRRRPGMKMVVSGTPSHDGIWLRPRFTPDEGTRYAWVNIETGVVLDHFSQIPKDAVIRPYTPPRSIYVPSWDGMVKIGVRDN